MDDDPPYRIEITREVPARNVHTKRLRRAVGYVLTRQGCDRADVEVALVNDAQISRLHEQYLNVPGPTDVLSFNLSQRDGGRLEGQLVVSVETAEREARRRNHSTEDEILLYCLHGALHLLGHDDAEPADAERMHALEDALLEDLGVGRVFSGSPRVRRAGSQTRKLPSRTRRDQSTQAERRGALGEVDKRSVIAGARPLELTPAFAGAGVRGSLHERSHGPS